MVETRLRVLEGMSRGSQKLSPHFLYRKRDTIQYRVCFLILVGLIRLFFDPPPLSLAESRQLTGQRSHKKLLLITHEVNLSLQVLGLFQCLIWIDWRQKKRIVIAITSVKRDCLSSIGLLLAATEMSHFETQAHEICTTRFSLSLALWLLDILQWKAPSEINRGLFRLVAALSSFILSPLCTRSNSPSPSSGKVFSCRAIFHFCTILWKEKAELPFLQRTFSWTPRQKSCMERDRSIHSVVQGRGWKTMEKKQPF